MAGEVLDRCTVCSGGMPFKTCLKAAHDQAAQAVIHLVSMFPTHDFVFTAQTVFCSSTLVGAV
jgi:hypothetical protein